MSLSQIKLVLETHINTNVTTTAIKWNNTQTYTLNSSSLTQVQIDNLPIYIEPMIIPENEVKEILSSGVSYKNNVFFQVLIYGKTNQGMGDIFSLSDDIVALFREQIISSVVIEEVKRKPSFTVGEWVVLPVTVYAFLRTT